MKWKLSALLLSCAAISLFEIASADRAYGVSSPAAYRAAADELIAATAAADPNARPENLSWQEIQKALQEAARQSGSAPAFFLSAQKILGEWQGGRGLRLLSNSDAAYYAYHQQAPQLREVGAWFGQKGAKWYVKQVQALPQQSLKRGDAVLIKDFHPVLSWSLSAPNETEIQSDLLGAKKKLDLKARPTQLGAWSLSATQGGSRVLSFEKKRICQEKLWLWLNSPVAKYLDSKIKAAQQNCDAQLIDLRDSFGEELPKGPFKAREKDKAKPVVVLINRGTSEQAVNLALKLKEELGARIVGEPSGSRLLPLQKTELKEMPWLLLVYEKAGGSLLPDQEVADSWMMSGAYDEVYEAGIKELKTALEID